MYIKYKVVLDSNLKYKIMRKVGVFGEYKEVIYFYADNYNSITKEDLPELIVSNCLKIQKEEQVD